MPIVTSSQSSLLQAAGLLKQGEVISFPTETVYGLGGVITIPSAIDKIFTLKGRPKNNPLIVHTHTTDAIYDLAEVPDRKLFQLLSSFWPGPMTLVLPAKEHVHASIRAGLSSVAVRIPSHPIALELLKQVSIPIAAPSANKSQHISPTTAAHVQNEFGDELFILDGGMCKCGIESTVISLLDSTPKILRHGIITAEMIHELISIPIGELIAISHAQSAHSPGSQPKHYAPRTPLYFADDTGISKLNLNQVARVFLSSPKEASNSDLQYQTIRILSENNDLTGAAHELYAVLRELDELGFEGIIIDRPPSEGIGRALLDRLVRATSQ